MINEWAKSDKTLAEEKLVKHKENQNKRIPGTKACFETALVGYKGEIWQYTDSDKAHNEIEYRCLITSSKIANSLAKKLGYKRKIKNGDEAVFKFKENMLPEALKAIKLPKSHQTRARLADAFRNRF